MKKAIIVVLAHLIGVTLSVGQIQLDVEGDGASQLVQLTSNSVSQGQTLRLERTEPLMGGSDLIELKIPSASGSFAAFIEAEHSDGGFVYRLFSDGSTAMLGKLSVGDNNTGSDEVTITDVDDDGSSVIRINTIDHSLIIGANSSNEGILGTTTDSRLAFRTNNINRAIITKTGEFGVGTPGPAANLHIRDDGTSGQQTIVAILESVASKRPLLLFSEGGSSLTNGMSIEYDGTSTGANNNLRINTSTGDVGLMVRNNGHVGISGTPSNLCALRVNQISGVPRALEITSNNGNNFWGFTHAGGQHLELDYNGTFKGSFDENSGNYISVSDRKLKSNIVPLTDDALDKVKALNPVSYIFKDQQGDRRSIGFIAQEVEVLFPELVHQIDANGQDVLSLSYSEFGVIAIKAIQQQQDQIDALKLELNQVADLKKDFQTIKIELEALINSKARVSK